MILKVDLQRVSGDKNNWWAWLKVHRAQTRSLGYDAALDVPENENIKIGSAGFDSSGVYPKRFQKADGAWRLLVTAFKGPASADSVLSSRGCVQAATSAKGVKVSEDGARK